jgi:hypothetical protein
LIEWLDMHFTQQLSRPHPPWRAAPVRRDDTTRYLCAGMHLDRVFADEAIREFLVEPTRQLPPHPGTDPIAVLGEAVAARTRRKLRDGALVVLMIAFLIVTPISITSGWFSVAALFVLQRVLTTARLRKTSGKVYLLLLVVVAALLGLAFSGLHEFVSGSAPWSAMVAAAMLAVLTVDRIVVWRLVTTRFGRNSLPPVGPLTVERPILGISPPRFIKQLHRHTLPQPEPPGSVPLVVYRGYDPFVGAGTEHTDSAWSMVMPLDRRPDARPGPEVTTDILYARIRHEIEQLIRATPLTPSQRLGELRVSELVVISAQELVDHLNEPATREVLPGLAQPPAATYPALDTSVTPPERAADIRRQRVSQLRSNPQEWARYYQRFQVETWDGDLVLTVHVHAAMDDTTLYVEWTPCVLLPIDRAFRSIDDFAGGVFNPLRQAVLRMVKLPITIFGRAWHTLAWISPLTAPSGRILPDAYGTMRSLREMAAGTDVHNYFQLTDVDRYLKILHGRYVRAVSSLLHEYGYSPASFKEQAVTVNHHNIHIGGSMAGNLVLGSGNTVGNVTSIEEYR